MAGRQRQRRPPQAQIAHWPAPIGGWNQIDSIAQMPLTDALQLDNVFPLTTYLQIRNGSAVYYSAPGVTPSFRSLMTYSTTGLDYLVAALGTQLVDITNPAAVRVIMQNTNSSYWQSTNFATPANPGGQFLIMCNGIDPVQVWQGGATTTAAQFTPDPAGSAPDPLPPFSMVQNYAGRLFYCSDVDLNLYYLDQALEYQGQVDALNLGQYLPKGGAIAFMGTWTRDNAYQGQNDLLVIGSTEGEVLCYYGYDPNTAGDFTLTGRFECGKPVAGHRQLTGLGPDMLLICEDGFQSMASYLALGQSKALATQISRKIGNAVTKAVQLGRTLPDWEATLYPKGNALLVNVPQPGAQPVQYVVNTMTGAWCRYLGLNAHCWCVFNDQLYFGTDNGTIMQADTGNTDNGNPIPFELVTAFQVMGAPANQKQATMCRPLLSVSGAVNIFMDVNVDYVVRPVTSPLDASVSEAVWDQFNWDAANWGYSMLPLLDWYSVQGIGTAFAVHMIGSTIADEIQILAFDMTTIPSLGFV